MIVFATLCCIIFLVIFLYGINVNRHWKNKGILYENPVLFLGNLKDVLRGRKHMGVLFSEIRRRFKEYPYCGIYKLMKPCILINDLELVKNVLVKDFSHFINNEFSVDPELDPIWSANAFNQKDQQWRETRKAWATSITPGKIRSLYEDFRRVADVMVEHVNGQVEQKPKEALNLRVLSSNFFSDATCNSIFGLKINSFVNPDNSYVKISNFLFTASFVDAIKGIILLVAPKLSKMLKIRFIPERINKELLLLTKEVISNRDKSGFRKDNILDSILLQTKKDTMSEIEIAAIFYSVFLNATETSSGTAAFMLHSLATHLDVQERLRAEVDSAVEEHGENLTYEILNELPYLDMVLCETLRMYPAILYAQRVCTSERYELPPARGEGSPALVIGRGTAVVVPIYGIHMDPELHPEPEKFSPERFEPERRAAMPKFAWIPFSEGPRFCLGNRFAINQIKMFVTTLIRNFEIRLSPEMIGKPISIDPNVFLCRSIEPLKATFHKRNLN